jgi:hypothetical protein
MFPEIPRNAPWLRALFFAAGMETDPLRENSPLHQHLVNVEINAHTKANSTVGD